MSVSTSPAVDAAALLDHYEQMSVIRRTEQAAHDLFLQGLVKGTTHLAAGHEAVAVGASAVALGTILFSDPLAPARIRAEARTAGTEAAGGAPERRVRADGYAAAPIRLQI